MRKVRLVLPALIFGLLGFVFVPGKAYADGAPQNGGFVGGISGWACYSSQYCGYDGTVGHTLVGAAKSSDAGGGWVTSGVMVIGSTSVLSLWAYGAQQTSFSVYTWDYDTNVEAVVATNVSITVGSWTNYTYSLAGWSGQHLAIRLNRGTNYTPTVYFDDVTVSDATNYNYGLNGSFDYNLGWILMGFGSGGYDIQNGYSNPGSWMQNVGGQRSIYSPMYRSYYGSWQICGKQYNTNAPSMSVYVSDMSGGPVGFTNLASYSLGSNWGCGSVSLNSYVGRDVMIRLDAMDAYVDDFCPTNSCQLQNATATPTLSGSATATPNYFPYGQGTPVPVVATVCPQSAPCYVIVMNQTPQSIDWSAFPTYPAFPTQIPFPTFCPPSAPCYIQGGNSNPVFVTTNGTPLPIEGGNRTPIFISSNGTPLPIQGGNSTPVVVANATTAHTPVVNLNTVGGNVNIGGNPSSTYNVNTGMSGVIPVNLNGNTSLSNLIDFQLATYDFSFCLPPEIGVAFAGTVPCLNSSVQVVTKFTLLGLDVGAYFALFTAFIFVFFIVAQLRHR